jgi:hypothetical protein
MSKAFKAVFGDLLAESEVNGRWVEYKIATPFKGLPLRAARLNVAIAQAKASRYPSTHINEAGDKVIVKRSEIWQERYWEEEEDRQRLDLGGLHEQG